MVSTTSLNISRATSRALPRFTSSITPSTRTFTNSTITFNTVPNPAQSSSQTTKLPTTHYRITLRRSAIGLPSRYTKILEGLGLHKRLSSVYQRQTPQAAGSILAVKELVHVDNVRRLDSTTPSSNGQVSNSDGTFGISEMMEELGSSQLVDDQEAVWVDENGKVVSWGKEARKAPKGFRIVGSLTDEKRDKEMKQREEHRKSFGL